MKVWRVGNERDHGPSYLFDLCVGEGEDFSDKKQWEYVKIKLWGGSVDSKYGNYCDGVCLSAIGVRDINGNNARHDWRFDLPISDLCEIVGFIRRKIQEDKSGKWAKHFAALIGEFASTVATAIEGIRGVDEDDEP